MGATYDSVNNNYTVGLALLSLTCLLTLLYTAWRLPGRSADTPGRDDHRTGQWTRRGKKTR